MSVADTVGDLLSDGGDMALICAWCQTMIREGPGSISHGICPDCAAKVNLDIDSEAVLT